MFGFQTRICVRGELRHAWYFEMLITERNFEFSRCPILLGNVFLCVFQIFRKRFFHSEVDSVIDSSKWRQVPRSPRLKSLFAVQTRARRWISLKVINERNINNSILGYQSVCHSQWTPQHCASPSLTNYFETELFPPTTSKHISSIRHWFANPAYWSSYCSTSC